MEGKKETVKVIENFTIFHFSDTHFGADISADKKSWLEKFLADLFQKALNKIGLAIHNSSIYQVLLDEFGNRTTETNHSCMFVHSGDVSAFGSRENLRLGNGLLESIRGFFIGVITEPEKALFIIPGNHDIVNINDKVDFPFNTDDFDREFYGKSGTAIYPRMLVPDIPGKSMVLVGLNSVNVEGNQNKKSALGIGLLDRKQLQDAEVCLKEREGRITKKIVALHHSPLKFPNIHRMDFLLLEEAPRFIEWLYGNKIDLVLCGHLHRDFHIYEKFELLLRKYNDVTSIKDINQAVLRIIKMRENLIVREYLTMGGKLVGEMERIAFSFIEKRLGNIILDKKVKRSLKRFYEKLKAYPEYTEFLDMIENLKKEKIRILVASTACQTNRRPQYNYWEIKMNLRTNSLEIFNNILDLRTNRFNRNLDVGFSSN